MNIPAFSVVTYYGKFHPHYQQDSTNAKHHSCWQLIVMHFEIKVKMPFCYTKSLG